jgi:hypothetical protein
MKPKNRLEPVERTYQLSPRLAALIELEYGSDADEKVSKAIVNEMNLPVVLVVDENWFLCEKNVGNIVNHHRALVDIDALYIKNALNLLNRLSGRSHHLVVVDRRLADSLSQYDQLFSMYSEMDGSIIALHDLIAMVSE